MDAPPSSACRRVSLKIIRSHVIVPPSGEEIDCGYLFESMFSTIGRKRKSSDENRPKSKRCRHPPVPSLQKSSPPIVPDVVVLEDPNESRVRELISGLTPSQKAVFDRVRSGESLFFTGEAGSGKSFLLNVIVESMRMVMDPGRVFVTASTGISACAIGGITLHSFAGLGLAEESPQALAAKLIDPKTPHMRRTAARWKSASVLVIDECSMISPNFFSKLDLVARLVRRSPNSPFGGLQIIMAGDFFQLPPVSRAAQCDSMMIFETDAWKQLIGDRTCVLTEVHRQKDEIFLGVLRNLRIGEMTQTDMALLMTRVKLTADEGTPHGVIRLYPTRREAEVVNEDELTSLPGEPRVFEARDTGDDYMVSANKDNWMAPQRVVLKEGAVVMIIKNLEVSRGVCNGTTGTVIDFTPLGNPRVKTDNGTVVTICNQTWEIRMGDVVLASRTQIPLVLAYAITIHKSQGMTLDRVQVNMSRMFEKSQLYVALSRCTSMDGLYLTGRFPDSTLLRPPPSVLEWWNSQVGRVHHPPPIPSPSSHSPSPPQPRQNIDGGVQQEGRSNFKRVK